MFLNWKKLRMKERAYSPFFVLRKKQMWKTVLYRAQVSAWHERGFKLSDIYWKQSGRKKTGTRLNQFSSSIRLQFLHHGFNWTVTTRESFERIAHLSSPWKKQLWQSLSEEMEEFVGYIVIIITLIPTAADRLMVCNWIHSFSEYNWNKAGSTRGAQNINDKNNLALA